MLHTVLFFAFTVLVSAAPSPYHHVIETPTSRVEQSINFSPRFQESYQVQKQDVVPFSNFQLPKQQVVYYYEHPQHGQQPVQLYGVRQDSPWWQELWNQIMGQGQGQEQGEGQGEGHGPTEEGGEESAEIPIGDSKITEPINILSPPLSMTSAGSALKQDPIKEETDVVVESVFTTQSPQVSSEENVIADDLESVRIDAAFRTTSMKESENYSADEITTPKVESTSAEATKATTEKVEIVSAEISTFETTARSVEVSTVTLKLEEETSTTSSPFRADNVASQVTYEPKHEREDESFGKQESDAITQDVSCRNGKEASKEAPSAMHHIYSINDQYYVVSGSPKFYGNVEPRSLMFSLQELQPVMRNDDYVDDNAKLQDVASLSMALKETSPAFMINVVDEGDEETKKEADDNDEPEQISARSQPLSDVQSLIVSKSHKEESRDEEKREETSAEGRGISDDSSIAQAKPSGIAIAGVGGVASSKPVANAISGPNGLSVASPSATAVAGDFLNNDDEDDRKRNMKPKRPQRRPAFDVNA